MITLFVFSIIASLSIFEDWYAELRTDWPEEPPRKAALMALIVLAMFWIAAVVTAYLVSSMFEVF